MGLGSIAAIAGIVLHPFGAASDSLEVGKAQFAFEDQGPILQLVRVQKTLVRDCNAWVNAATKPPVDSLAPVSDSESLRKAWEPWDKEDLEAVQGCDNFP